MGRICTIYTWIQKNHGNLARVFPETVTGLICACFPVFPMAVFLVCCPPLRYNQCESFSLTAENRSQIFQPAQAARPPFLRVCLYLKRNEGLLWIKKFGSDPKGSVVLAEKP